MPPNSAAPSLRRPFDHDPILSDAALIGLVLLAGDVCGTMIGNQRMVLIRRNDDTPRLAASRLLATRIGLAASISIDSGVERMHEHRAHRFTSGSAPFQQSLVGTGVGADRQLDVVRLQVSQHPSHTAPPLKLGEDQANDALRLLVRVQDKAARRTFYITDRRQHVQVASPRFVEQRLVHPSLQEMDFRLAHHTAQAKQQPIIVVCRVVQAVLIGQQRAKNRGTAR